jgi:alpha-tubulin suppressor-like RCC1 family protein
MKRQWYHQTNSVINRPPGEPGDVPELNNLGDPIKHIAAGGYCLAALTESGSIYVWGQKSVGQSQTAHSVFPELSGIPNYSEVDGGKDVKDIALGDSHAILLTTASAVYVIGRNSNGQLGLSLGSEEEAKTWTRVPLDIPDSRQVLGVAAGPRSSFILTAPTKRAT